METPSFCRGCAHALHTGCAVGECLPCVRYADAVRASIERRRAADATARDHFAAAPGCATLVLGSASYTRGVA